MSTKTINIEESPTSLDELLKLLHEDDEILLTKDGKPLARLSAVDRAAQPALQRIPGLHAGTTWVSDDFDDPLPDEFWLGHS